METKPVLWTNAEVKTFLSLVADQRIQRELDGATRNERIYQEVSERMAAHGYSFTMKQCREKLEKLKSDYWSIKDHNGRSGSNRRAWKWFDQMDAIYGQRPASNGRESGLDSAAALLETESESLSTWEANSTSIMEPPSSPASSPAPAAASTPTPTPSASTSSTSQQRRITGKRKRGDSKLDLPEVLAAMQAEEERNRAQRDEHIQLFLSEAREAREHEAALRREEIAQNADFNQAVLGVLGQLVQAAGKCE